MDDEHDFFAGRLELIAAVVQGIEGFWLHAFPMPKTVLEKINKLCRDFLWAGGHAKVAWKDICMPKSEGGLGLRNNSVCNAAIIMKILWDIHANKDSLRIKWVHVAFILEEEKFGTGTVVMLIRPCSRKLLKSGIS